MDVTKASQALIAPNVSVRSSSPASPKKSEEAKSSPQQGVNTAQAVSVRWSNIAQKMQPVAETESAVKASAIAENEEDIAKTVDEFNDRLQEASNSTVKFQIDSESGDVIVQVVDRNTEEVVRQIPPEEIVALKERLAEMRGLLFDLEG